jgi:hypothetical protein
MCGCFEIKFNFAETFKYPKDTANYKASKVKNNENSFRMVLIEDERKFHPTFINCWKRNDCKHYVKIGYLKTQNFMISMASEDWKFKTVSKNKVAGQ